MIPEMDELTIVVVEAHPGRGHAERVEHHLPHAQILPAGDGQNRQAVRRHEAGILHGAQVAFDTVDRRQVGGGHADGGQIIGMGGPDGSGPVAPRLFGILEDAAREVIDVPVGVPPEIDHLRRQLGDVRVVGVVVVAVKRHDDTGLEQPLQPDEVALRRPDNLRPVAAGKPQIECRLHVAGLGVGEDPVDPALLRHERADLGVAPTLFGLAGRSDADRGSPDRHLDRSLGSRRRFGNPRGKQHPRCEQRQQ